MNTFAVDGGQAFPTPTPGRIVHYRLSAEDVARINDAATAPGAAPLMNPHSAGDLLPAIIVRIYGKRVSMQAFLDGDLGTLWIPPRPSGNGPGRWIWPGR